jgi:hypothetical protein
MQLVQSKLGKCLLVKFVPMPMPMPMHASENFSPLIHFRINARNCSHKYCCQKNDYQITCTMTIINAESALLNEGANANA